MSKPEIVSGKFGTAKSSTEVKIDQEFFEKNILEIIKTPHSFALKLNDEAYAKIAWEIANRLVMQIKIIAQEQINDSTPASWTHENPEKISEFSKWMIGMSHTGRDPLKSICSQVIANASWPYWSDDFTELVSFVSSFHDIKERPVQVAGFTKLWSVYESSKPTFTKDLKLAVDVPTKRVKKVTKVTKKKVAKKKSKR